MSIHINFVCDKDDCKNERGSKHALPCQFDHINETWGDLITFAKMNGWHVELEYGKVTKTLCPNHLQKNK